MAYPEQVTSPPQVQAEVVVNENLEALAHQAVYAKKAPTTTGLTWGYYGGRWGGFSVSDGTLSLTDSATNYVVVAIATGVASVSTSNTNWNNATDYVRVYQLTTAGGVVTATQDHRAGPGGVHGGAGGGGGGGGVTSVDASGGVETASGSPITSTGTVRGSHKVNTQTSTTYALIATDRGKHVTLSNAASIAVSIAQAGTTGFEDGYFTIVECIGVGAATITPATSVINGQSTLLLDGGMAAIIFSDGTNYRAIVFDAAGVTVNAQTGTSYTYLSGDRGKLVTHTNGSSIAGTLPQATGAFGSRWFTYVQNRGSGTLTITPTTSTIDGASSLALTTGQGVLIVSDGTNYFTMRGAASGGGGGLTNWTEAVNTSAPNATVPVSSFTATNAASNVDAAVVPKGTGAFLSRVPDGTSAGGDKSGTEAVDLQRVRASAGQVASGTRSSLIGGQNKTASGLDSGGFAGDGGTASGQRTATLGGKDQNVSGVDSVACGGDTTTVSGNYAGHVGGQNLTVSANRAFGAGGLNNLIDGANASCFGERASSRTRQSSRVLASGAHSGVSGGQQLCEMILRAGTFDNTQTTMTADTGAAGATNSLVLPDDSLAYVRGRVAARQNNATTDSASWYFEACIVRGSGAATTAMVAACTPTLVAAAAGAAAWALAVDADTTAGALRIRVTGENSKIIRWVCHVESLEVVP